MNKVDSGALNRCREMAESRPHSISHYYRMALSSDSVKNLLIEGRFQSTNIKRLESVFGVLEPVELDA